MSQKNLKEKRRGVETHGERKSIARIDREQVERKFRKRTGPNESQILCRTETEVG